MERSRQATSGWRRTSIAAFSAVFAFILARITLRNRPALPPRAQAAARSLESADDRMDSQIRLRAPITMASAPPDFAAKVLTRIATMPAPAPVSLASGPSRVSWLQPFRVVVGTLGIALVLMLATGVLVTLISPSLAVAILDALMTAALGLLALARSIGQLIARAAATPWMIPATMAGLLGFLLLSWTQLARQFGRDPQEA
ncbi:MAG TPA: hypothetical protein VFN11_13930 [Ktedonobacterales bacterium]|nr:hypothetical protein [Ktedonobacterales bacterium]